MDSETLKNIKTRCDAATIGPWTSFIEGRNHESGSNFIKTGALGTENEDIEISGGTIADQDFIAGARQDIPMLLEEIAKLQELLKTKKQT